MKLTKFGHCCLLIEEKGVRVLTDPGAFTDGQNSATNIDVVLITHEHMDHFHVDSVKKVLANNPDSLIITNSAVNALLEKEGITGAKVVEDTQVFEYKGIGFRGFGTLHAEIYEERGRVMNTGYFIGDRLYYPGDSFHDPNIEVDVLAMPVGGPWLRIKDAIQFALAVNPKKAFPVHDGLFNDFGTKVSRNFPTQVLAENGIEFISIENNKEYEL